VQANYHALVRSDGKLLSEADISTHGFVDTTTITAKVQDGFLVGVADNVYFAGKGKYPIYDFKE
jgi:hypothetical protein